VFENRILRIIFGPKRDEKEKKLKQNWRKSNMPLEEGEQQQT
jgi:hypothetical protein